MLYSQPHRHTQGRTHTHAATKLSKLQVSLLLTVIRDTWCVSTHHLILTRGCDKGTRHLPHPSPLPPEHLARLHFPDPLAVRCTGEPELYRQNVSRRDMCRSQAWPILTPHKPPSRPFPEAGTLGMSIKDCRVTRQGDPGSLSQRLEESCLYPNSRRHN